MAGTQAQPSPSLALDAWGFRVAAWIGVGLLAIGLVLTAINGRWNGVLTLTIFLILSVVFIARERRLPALFDLLFVLAALINAAGWVWDLYRNVPGYDEVAHAYTTFAVALTLGFLVYYSVRLHFRERGWLSVLAIASFGLALGAVWEMVEWLFIGTLKDPVSDLYMDALGALLAGIVCAAVLRRLPAEQLRD